MNDTGLIHIMALKAHQIVKPFLKDNDKDPYEQKYQVELGKKYNGTIPYSLDIKHLVSHNSKSICFNNKKKKTYSDAIIDVSFDSSLKKEEEGCYRLVKSRKRKVSKAGLLGSSTGYEKAGIKKTEVSNGKTLYSKDEIRRILYTTGFYIGGIKYVAYKRSASKSRAGHMLFIDEKYYDHMIEWSRMGTNGIKFEKGDTCNEYPSLKAYESLTLSGIEGIVNLTADQILFVDDITPPFRANVSVTRLVDGEVMTSDIDNFEMSNTVFDGESLVDKSIFDADPKFIDKGMILLRNRFFKSCGFNTDIQGWLANNTDRTGKTTVRDQLTGEEKVAANIRMITTPSSLKLFKFAAKLFPDAHKDDYRRLTVQFWLNNLEPEFGVCKTEKKSPFDNCHRLSYQMINTLPLTKADIDELTADEIHYINLLKTNLAVFKHHIGAVAPNVGRSLMLNLLNYNDNIQYTADFKQFREDTIRNYTDDVKSGKVRIRETDYCVICGNPFELLTMSTSEIATHPIIHKGKEIWCSRFADGTDLVGFRNPHIASGNVLVAKNKWDENLKWFNLTDNIVVINSFDNDIFDRLQGCDLDSDTVLLSSDPLLLRKGQECQRFRTPIKYFKGDEREYHYSPLDSANIDVDIAQNAIGQIVNAGQMLNSAYWDIAYHDDEGREYFDYGDADEKIRTQLSRLYDNISLLSSMSQLEIDKAKKSYDFGKDAKGKRVTVSEILKRVRNDNCGLDAAVFDKTETRRPKASIPEEDAHKYAELTKTILGLKLSLSTLKKEKTPIDIQRKRIFADARAQWKAQHNADIAELQKKITGIADEAFKLVSEDCKVSLRPSFFKAFTSPRYSEYTEDCSTAMMFLRNAFDGKIEKFSRSKPIPITDFLIDQPKGSVNYEQIKTLKKLAEECDEKRGMLFQKDLKGKEREKAIAELCESESAAISNIKEWRISRNTVLNIIKRYYHVKHRGEEGDDFGEHRRTVLGLLYAAKPELVLNCIKPLSPFEMIELIEDEQGEIHFFGKKYSILSKTVTVSKVD